jgi:hypothetical protein
MNYIDQLTKELMVQEHVLRELQQEQERRRLLQQEHNQWSNKIHNLRWVKGTGGVLYNELSQLAFLYSVDSID